MTATTSSGALARATPATIARVVGFAVALAAAAQVAIPLPGTPVPFTLQPLLVVLAGFWLGPVAGAASMTLYLLAGAAGLPVFAPVGAPGVARLLGPTGGYLLAYPVAAAVVGALATRASSIGGRFATRVAIAIAGCAQKTTNLPPGTADADKFLFARGTEPATARPAGTARPTCLREGCSLHWFRRRRQFAPRPG